MLVLTISNIFDTIIIVHYENKVIKENFGDRVKNFITFNEPSVFVGCGYQGGMHAPGLQLGTKDLLRIGHNILLSHGKAVKVLREIPDAKTASNSFRA